MDRKDFTFVFGHDVGKLSVHCIALHIYAYFNVNS